MSNKVSGESLSTQRIHVHEYCRCLTTNILINHYYFLLGVGWSSMTGLSGSHTWASVARSTHNCWVCRRHGMRVYFMVSGRGELLVDPSTIRIPSSTTRRSAKKYHDSCSHALKLMYTNNEDLLSINFPYSINNIIWSCDFNQSDALQVCFNWCVCLMRCTLIIKML